MHALRHFNVTLLGLRPGGSCQLIGLGETFLSDPRGQHASLSHGSQYSVSSVYHSHCFLWGKSGKKCVLYSPDNGTNV